MRKIIKIKPNKSIYMYISFVWTVIWLIIGSVAIISVYNKNHEFTDIILSIVFVSIMIIVGIVIYALFVFFQGSYYVIDKTGITHIYKKKVRIKIPIENIVVLGCRKCPWYRKIGMALNVLFSSDTKCDLLSIRHKNADVYKINFVLGGTTSLCTLTSEDMRLGVEEYCDYFSRRQIKKISKLMNIPISYDIKVVDVINGRWGRGGLL